MGRRGKRRRCAEFPEQSCLEELTDPYGWWQCPGNRTDSREVVMAENKRWQRNNTMEP